jgi:gluconolactonase
VSRTSGGPPLEVVVVGLSEPETPVSLGGGVWLVAEMGRGCVSRVDLSSGQITPIARTGRPNGVARDAVGTIWVAECFGLGDDDRPGLKRVDLDGCVHAVADSHDGVPLRWPNDIAIGPDEAVYFTDSGISALEIIPERKPLDYGRCDGRVYRYDQSTGELSLLDEGLAFANGLVFGQAGELYVTESGTGLVHRYAVGTDGSLGVRRTLANVIDPDGPNPSIVGPDGLAVGCDGRLYVAVYGQGDIAVLDPGGSLLGAIPTGGALPTNCAFGPDGRLYVTECEQGALVAVDVRPRSRR